MATTNDRTQDAADLSTVADEEPERVREMFHPDGGLDIPRREKFRLFCDVVTYRWLNPKPEPWAPVAPHALDWHRHLHEGDYSPMILAGRKHTKTTWVLCELLYHLEYIDHFRALYWCNNVENQLTSRMNELEEMIEANLWLGNLHKGNPDLQNNVPAGVKEKNFSNGSTLYGTAVGAGSEGDHVNMVVGDDPLKELGDISDEDIVDYYKKVIVPMADSSDLSTIVGTRKRPKDIYHLLLQVTSELEEYNLAGYRLLEYPAVQEAWDAKYADRPDHLAARDPGAIHSYATKTAPDLAAALGLPGDEVSVLWPDARGPDFLLGKLARQGKPSFMREFCMVFTHVKDAIIKRSLIDDPPVSIPDMPPRTRAELGERDVDVDRVAIGIDPAVVEGSDYAAWVVLAVEPDDTRHVLHATYNDGLSPKRIRKTTVDLDDRYEPDVIVWESNGWQEWLADEQVEFPSHLPMKKAGTTQRKHSWQSGVPRIAGRIEDGDYRFYTEDSNTEDLIDALCSLRMDDNDHLAGHTPDLVMALYMAEKGLTEFSGLSSSRTGYGGSEREREAKETARSKREELSGNPVGDAIVGAYDEQQDFYG